MTTTINAVTGTGLTQTSDGSGIVKLQSNGVATNALAWVNFNGSSGATAARASYNVSSVTRVSQGVYTITFTNSTTDANYAPVAMCNRNTTTTDSASINYGLWTSVYNLATTGFGLTYNASNVQTNDAALITLVVHGN